MTSSHSRPRLIAGSPKSSVQRLAAAAASENLNDAVETLKRSAEIVSRLALQRTDAPEATVARLESLSDLCLAARQLAGDDDVFRSLLDMALLHASNRLFTQKPEHAASGVIAVAPRFSRAAGDLGADI